MHGRLQYGRCVVAPAAAAAEGEEEGVAAVAVAEVEHSYPPLR